MPDVVGPKLLGHPHRPVVCSSTLLWNLEFTSAGRLILDKISRPYFPTKGEDQDETEIEGGEVDEYVQAMRKHIAFVFTETTRWTGLQILLIEHAYFADVKGAEISCVMSHAYRRDAIRRDAFRDDFAAGAPRRRHCRITWCALAKRSMRTPMVEIADIRRHHSTQTSFVEDK
jgi:hypothetical protein